MENLKTMLHEVPLTLAKVSQSCKKSAPTIMTGVGVVGFVATVVVACQETPKAMELMDEESKKQKVNGDHGFNAKAKMVVTVAPAYLPAIGLGIATIGCFVGANYVNLKRNAALATALGISAREFSEYKGVIADKIGEKGVTEVTDTLAKKHIDETDIPTDDDILDTGDGHTRCFDTFSGRYFWSDAEKLRQYENDINHDMINNGMFTLCLNDVYEIMGLPPVKIGEDLGWNAQRDMVHFSYSSQLDKNRNPVLVVAFQEDPYHDFYFSSIG
jgi:hypothetical protein